MPTILVKGLSEETLKQLKRLKVELDCDSWAQLLEKLSETRRTSISFSKKEISEMRQGSRGFLALADSISKKWTGEPTILEEFRKSRKHE